MKNLFKNYRFAIVILGWSLLSFACSSDEGTPAPDGGDSRNPVVETNGDVTVVLTSSDKTSLLKELPAKLPLSDQAGNGNLTISIDESQIKQTVEGFGAALTGSSAFLLNNNQEALTSLFGKDGINLSYTRLTVGASDFNKNGSFTYNDITGDEDLNLDKFSMEKDSESNNPVIPVAKAILGLNSTMKFMASPWSPPAWMKSNKMLNGGSLVSIYYDVYADYLIKYINGYKAEGIPINTITIQNEPLNETSAYPSMKMPAKDQATFIGKHFGPKLKTAGLDTKIIGYDHNFWVDEDPDYPVTILEDVEAAKYTNAIGYHAYGGQVSDLSKVTDQFPNAELYFTEQSGIENANTTFGGEIKWFMKNVFMGTLRRGAKSILLWNLALDENAGPKNGGCDDCRGVLKITSGGTVEKNVEYYMLGHFSKYVDSGAQVIATNDLPGILENVAFKNPDGSKVLVIYNASGSGSPQNVNVKVGSKNFGYAIPQGALVTFKWK